MNLSPWTQAFATIYSESTAKFAAGADSPKKILTEEQISFLSSIGISSTNMFDWVEDFADHAEPSYEIALLLAATRREYFLQVQNSTPSTQTVTRDDLPGKDSVHNGVVYLPRITAKALGFLRGELCSSLMFSCGGDRHFLKSNNLDPVDFLRLVQSLDGDLDKLSKSL